MRQFSTFTLTLLALSCSSDRIDSNAGGAGAGAINGNGAGGAAQGGSVASTGGADGKSGGGAAGSSNADAVTWSEHIAPLVYRECIGCHRSGGIGPFPLTEYADAKPVAAALAGAVEAREMPPMPVNGGGACNRYQNARWLSDAEIALFRAWSSQGAPEGNPALAPALPPAPAGLTGVTATLDTGMEYSPNAALSDDYRCFVVDSGLSADTFLTGYEVVPGDARVVHHAIVYSPSTAAAASAAQALDEAAAGQGYTCFGGAGVDAEPRVLWAPGVGVTEMPAGTGLPLVGGRKLILQIHYNLSAGSFPDRTRVRLQTTASVARPAQYFAVADTRMSVAPGQALGTTTRSVPGVKTPVVVHGVLPHMHTLGRTLHVTANAASGDSCLVDVDRWDFHWQNAWWYDAPLEFPSLANVTITCAYDTRNRTTPVTWGEGTSDEMCLAYLYVTGP
jgi:hypothetical protein